MCDNSLPRNFICWWLSSILTLPCNDIGPFPLPIVSNCMQPCTEIRHFMEEKLFFSWNQFSKNKTNLESMHACNQFVKKLSSEIAIFFVKGSILWTHFYQKWFLYFSVKFLKFLFLYCMIPLLLCSISFCCYSFHYTIPFHLLTNQGTELHPALKLFWEITGRP